MSWAARRRLVIVAIIATVVLIVLALISFFSFYKAPSCSDGVQDQQEVGIDCGGPCPYLCQSQAQAPVVRFTQSVPASSGRTDVIAYIDNPNTSSYARNVAYTISLYASDHTLAAPVVKGTIDIPAGATVPVYIPNIVTGNAVVTDAFLALNTDAIKWQSGTDTRVLPAISSQTLGGTATNPRITAVLTNPSTQAMKNITVIIGVYDASGNILDASQTIVQTIQAQGSASAIFTWNAAFAAPVARVDVLPLVPLSTSVVSPTP